MLLKNFVAAQPDRKPKMAHASLRLWWAATKFFNIIEKITYRENRSSYEILQQHVRQHPMFAKKTEFCVAQGRILCATRMWRHTCPPDRKPKKTLRAFASVHRKLTQLGSVLLRRTQSKRVKSYQILFISVESGSKGALSAFDKHEKITIWFNLSCIQNIHSSKQIFIGWYVKPILHFP